MFSLGRPSLVARLVSSGTWQLPFRDFQILFHPPRQLLKVDLSSSRPLYADFCLVLARVVGRQLKVPPLLEATVLGQCLSLRTSASQSLHHRSPVQSYLQPCTGLPTMTSGGNSYLLRSSHYLSMLCEEDRSACVHSRETRSWLELRGQPNS